MSLTFFTVSDFSDNFIAKGKMRITPKRLHSFISMNTFYKIVTVIFPLAIFEEMNMAFPENICYLPHYIILLLRRHMV
jgi:hypothetical protein